MSPYFSGVLSSNRVTLYFFLSLSIRNSNLSFVLLIFKWSPTGEPVVALKMPVFPFGQAEKSSVAMDFFPEREKTILRMAK